MSIREVTMAARPDFPWLACGNAEAVGSLMLQLNWLREGERVESCERAGEGNMNLTLRVKTSERSLVLKQARPWVEKYDTISAPWGRSLVEQRFYDRVASINAVAARMPRLIASDGSARVILMEDLGESRDFTDLYKGGEIAQETVRGLAQYLRALHEATEGEDHDPLLLNRDMRALNHAHIYDIPLRENNGVELDKYELWLDRQAAVLRQDAKFTRRVVETGERYLADGSCLLHGDFFPGSWLRVGVEARVIDPEFCYFGDPEYDLGVAVAHFRMSERDLDLVGDFLRAYTGRDLAARYDARLIARYAAAEVMRRLIGVAQLPIPPSQGLRARLLRASRAAMMDESVEALWT